MPVPTADPAAQRRLLDVAANDQAAAAAGHRRNSLPELAVLAEARARADALDSRLVVVRTEIGDLDREARKLDEEIEQVRGRAARDSARMAGGGVPAKELEGLEHEIVSLARRQSTLEDQALDLMEQREAAGAVEAGVRAELAEVTATAEAAAQRRDDAFADIDDELARLAARRAVAVADLPAELMAVYERIRGTGKIAAGELRGETCSACRMHIDRVALDELRSAPDDSVQRCPECGAILVRG
jgi:predicted  nucleic acid-binding Zn-ribbon protein